MLGCVVLANLPDVDYVPGVIAGEFNRWHHFYTHTPGWCVLVAGGVWCLWRVWRRVPMTAFGWLLALLLSHLAADYLTEDRRPPQGIMALWPVNDRFYIAPVQIFAHLKKDHYADFVQWHNFRAALLEVAWCAPLLIAAAMAVLPRKRPAC